MAQIPPSPSPQWAMASSFTRFLDQTQRRTTFGRTPLDDWSALRRDLLPDNTQHSQQTDIHAPPPVGFKPTMSAGERQQTYALDRAATRTGPLQFSTFLWIFLNWMLMMMIHVKHVKMLEIVLLGAMAYTNLKSVPSNRLGLQQNILWQRIHTLQTGVHNVVKNVGATSKF